ncbi:putative iron-regulated membrane protein [Pseudonocardia hierapolitana]|uniref:Putative iron-regulated membrane protein n=1 Tax=Pseudonocardia hierapolitana TaxID=1128676 RepID=A0A561SWM1_9PSEU|nr:PepSY-associated TM helix domain-containing protein [Pseudonocardia hierapolitana]TWF79258.1 putative iron-regulated membrane protein [Pseudonocardia hierapolitana]
MSVIPNSTTSPPTRSRSGWRGLVLRLHFYAGLLVGPFILVAVATGLLYVLTPQLEDWLYDEQLRVPPTAQQLPLADQVRAAVATNPTGDLAAVRPAPEPGATTRVLFDDESLGESERRTVFVDPGTGEVMGSLVTYGTSGVLPFRMTIDQLHRNLLLGEPGRLYSELAASWLWVVALGGLALWVARWRARRAAVRDLVRPEPGARGRGRILTRHGSLGVWLLLGALFLSATGLTWSAYAGENISSLRAALGWSTPSLDVGGHAGHGGGPAADVAVDPARFDAVLGAARVAGIDAGMIEIARPAEHGAAWTVTEIGRGWPTEVDAVAIDGDTGTVVDQVRFADYPLVAKLARWGIDAHMGVLFGVANQLVLVAFGLGLITLILLGYRMWWQRRPTRGGAWRLVPRGRLRNAAWPVVAVAVLLAVLLGWFAPLLGISLLAFLVIDAALGRLDARRSRHVRSVNRT